MNRSRLTLRVVPLVLLLSCSAAEHEQSATPLDSSALVSVAPEMPCASLQSPPEAPTVATSNPIQNETGPTLTVAEVAPAAGVIPTATVAPPAAASTQADSHDVGGTTCVEPAPSVAVSSAEAGPSASVPVVSASDGSAPPSTPQGSAGAPANIGPVAVGAAGNAEDERFTLVFRDDFDTLDANRWQIMTHSWDSNLALFSAESVKVDGGLLSLSLLPAPEGTLDDTGTAKQFLGAEVRSLDTVTYGRVTARANLAAGSAVISALVTIYTPWPADNWNELDMEFLGANPDRIQFNTMVYTGEPNTAPVTESVTPTQDPHEQTLDFDPSADFHTYSMEWTPEAATFSIDEQVLYRWTTNIELLNLAQNVLLTIWASSSADWAGPVTDATSHAVARYDWVELYRWQ